MRHAPVLLVSSVFDAALCRDLITTFDATGGQPSSHSLRVNNKPVLQADTGWKQRLDLTFTDRTHPALVNRCRMAIEIQLLPMVLQAFAFETTQIERYLVGCYDAASGDHFKPHRDNDMPFTAHRKF